MALAGIFNNEISLSTISTDSVYFYSEIYTDKYNASDLSTIVLELKERLSHYYNTKEILGNDVEIFQFKDKLLVLSILRERKDNSINQRSVDCNYTESHPFEYNQTNCQSNIAADFAFEERFNNTMSNGCYLDDLPEEMTNPTPWNYMFMYRNIPNPSSNDFLYFESCEEPQACINRIGNATDMINIFNCSGINDPAYCAYVGFYNQPGIKKLYMTDIIDNNCLAANTMNVYQQRLAELSEDLRDNYLYGLSPSWVPHLVVIKQEKNNSIGKKSHKATFEYITYGYNPKNGPGHGF